MLKETLLKKSRQSVNKLTIKFKYTLMEVAFINRRKLIDDFESRVVIPRHFYYPTPNGGRFPYYDQDGNHREIVIASSKEAAFFLHKHNLIHTYTPCINGEYNMYIMTSLVQDGSGPVHRSNPVRVKWEDFQFTDVQAQRFAAVNELEIYESKYGAIRRMIEQIRA